VTSVAEPDFPRERMERVGATPEQAEQLQSEFNSSDLVVRQSLSQQWASMSDGMLGAHLTELVESGHFAEAQEEAADESALQDPAGEPGHEDSAPSG
jgi:hypothetical protein